MKIAMLQVLTPELDERVRALVPSGFTLEITKSVETADLLRVIADADYAVAFGMTVPDEVLRAAPRLRLLHRWGVGVDGVSLGLCRELDVVVAKTTGCNARPVAEFTIGLMLASSRLLNIAHNSMQQGEWRKKELWLRNQMLFGRRIGLVGLGAIGKEVARRLRGFDCDVLYAKRTPLDAQTERDLGIRYAPFDEILEADIVSLHCPLNAETRNMISWAELNRMQRHAILINTARGGLVNEQDLAAALKQGIIRSAAIDVFQQEPVSPDNPLIGLDNALLSPHIAANAFDNIDNEIAHWMGNIQRHSEGRPLSPDDIVTAS